jgi:hypothetical protein
VYGLTLFFVVTALQLELLKKAYQTLAASSEKEKGGGGGISKAVFMEKVIRPRFVKFGNNVMDRVYEVINFNGGKQITFEEYLCCIYVFDFANRDSQFRCKFVVLHSFL